MLFNRVNGKCQFIAVFILMLGLCVTAQAKYSGGTGEPSTPYRIADANDMNEIGTHPEDWGSHFVLVNDINLADYTGTQFNIIGPEWGTPFTGVFDGNNHIISNFTYNSSDQIYAVGIFGRVSGVSAEIKDLGLIDVNVNAKALYGVASLVGVLSSGTVSRCYVDSGSVSANHGGAGGLIGYNVGGTISYSYAAVSVSGGGLVFLFPGFHFVSPGATIV